MSTPNDQQGKAVKNSQATTSIVLGILALVFSLFNFAPGILSSLGCVGLVAALLAFFSGIQGLRAAKDLDGQGHALAIVGIVAAALCLFVFFASLLIAAIDVQRMLS